MKAAERVIFNTIVLYGRLLIVLIIGLFTTRIVLDALGESNYGIYTLVAGVVGMLAVLQSAMASTSMRYMSHSLGSGNSELISRTFNTTLFLHFIIGIAVLIFIEAGGYIMFKYFLDIPQVKIFDAKVIFHLMALTTFVAIIAVPYDAVINSHENLLVLSIVDILGSVLKLCLAIYLMFSNLNLLIIYGFGMFLVQVLMRVIKQRFSVKRYKECKIDLRKFYDKELSREIMSFTGWNLFGSIASMSVTQVRSVLLNMFFGVQVNAAEGISNTASNQVNNVSVNLTRAINPQLVKSEGSGDRQKMLRITYLSTKFSVILFALVAIPVIIEMPFLLDLWLKDVPEFAVVFAQLNLIGLFLSKFTFEITNAIRAVGKIRKFQIVETIILVCNLPVSYGLFKAGYSPESVYVVAILFSFMASIYRLYIGKRITDMSIVYFIKQGVLPTLIPLLAATGLGILLRFTMSENIIRLILILILCPSAMIFSMWYFGLNDYELSKIRIIAKSLKNQFIK